MYNTKAFLTSHNSIRLCLSACCSIPIPYQSQSTSVIACPPTVSFPDMLHYTQLFLNTLHFICFLALNLLTCLLEVLLAMASFSIESSGSGMLEVHRDIRDVMRTGHLSSMRFTQELFLDAEPLVSEVWLEVMLLASVS